MYRSPNIVRVIKSRRLRWAGRLTRTVEGRGSFKILTGKSTGNRPLGESRRRWEDVIRMDFKEIGINTRNRLNSCQDRSYWRALVNATLSILILTPC